jgi:hypothetical protein
MQHVVASTLSTGSYCSTQMNYLLLVAALTSPAVAFAQQRASDNVGQRLASAALLDVDSIQPERPLSGSSSLRYSSGYIVARPAFLYRKLSDVQPGRYVHRLRPGDHVFEVRYTPNSPWLRVARETYARGATCHCDTVVYYLHKAALQPKSGAPPRLFSLH